MKAILEVKDLVKKYGDFTAVKGISFDIKEGEIFSLLGPNGAGKTTTISMLSTLYTPTSGDATIGGHSVTKEPMAVRNLIGVVPQELALYDDLTARENLVFWGQMYGLSGKTLKIRVDEVLEQIGLTDKAKNRVKTYSGGMKRRVNIGVGLLHKPSLLFMDEPTVGIDPQSRRAILDSVKDAQPAGHDGPLHHPLHGRGRGAFRPGRHHRPRRTDRPGHAGRTDQAGRREWKRSSCTSMRARTDPETPGRGRPHSCQGVLKADVTDHTVTVIVPEAEEITGPGQSPRPTNWASRSARWISRSPTWKQSSCI